MNRRKFIQKSALAAGTAGMATSIMANAKANATTNSFSSPVDTPLDQSLPLRFRQIHLDFHTGGAIPNVAEKFDAEEFASILEKANVNSVTVFGRCHHGYIYHQTDKFPERRHPNIKYQNLLEDQIEACHKKNIRTPIYVTVQWDEFTTREHPEWLMRDEEGRPYGNEVFEPGFYEHLCIHTPYLDFLKEYLTELFEKVPVDGLFLDIHHIYPNANEACLAGMRAKGLDASKPAVRYAYYESVMKDYKEDLTAFVRKLDKNCTIFFNGGHVGPDIRNGLSAYSHLELESLPSGGWGYLHFPLTSRFARTLDKDFMGMTGKFHTSWGDSHSLKNKAALEFECFMMLAMNGKCSIGDQLHPSGAMDTATYDLIGRVYKQVAEKEAYCANAKAVTEIGVFSTEEILKEGVKTGRVKTPIPMMGVVRMLQEGKHQFDVLDSQSELSAYKLLVLPDEVQLDDALKNKIEKFVADGGSVIASYQSGLDLDKNKFASSIFGLEMKGEAPYSPDFIQLDGTGIGKGMPQTELVMYMKGMEVQTTTAKEILPANVPYFNRTWEHFSSHKHTPSSSKKGYPAVTQNGKVIYFMHPIFTQYAQNAAKWCRDIFLNAVDMLLGEPLVKMENAPSATIATLNEQTEENRWVMHILHYVPERRGLDFDVVEDVYELRDLQASVKVGKKARRVTTAPQGSNLRFKQVGDRIEFTLPALKGHQMVSIQF